MTENCAGRIRPVACTVYSPVVVTGESAGLGSGETPKPRTPLPFCGGGEAASNALAVRSDRPFSFEAGNRRFRRPGLFGRNRTSSSVSAEPLCLFGAGKQQVTLPHTKTHHCCLLGGGAKPSQTRGKPRGRRIWRPEVAASPPLKQGRKSHCHCHCRDCHGQGNLLTCHGSQFQSHHNARNTHKE